MLPVKRDLVKWEDTAGISRHPPGEEDRSARADAVSTEGIIKCCHSF